MEGEEAHRCDRCGEYNVNEWFLVLPGHNVTRGPPGAFPKHDERTKRAE